MQSSRKYFYVQPEAYAVIASADFYIFLATPNTNMFREFPKEIFEKAGAKLDHTLI